MPELAVPPMAVVDAELTTFETSNPPLVRLRTSVALANVRLAAVVALLATFNVFTLLPPAVTARAVPTRRMFCAGWLATNAVPS